MELYKTKCISKRCLNYVSVWQLNLLIYRNKKRKKTYSLPVQKMLTSHLKHVKSSALSDLQHQQKWFTGMDLTVLQRNHTWNPQLLVFPFSWLASSLLLKLLTWYICRHMILCLHLQCLLNCSINIRKIFVTWSVFSSGRSLLSLPVISPFS